MTIQKDFLLRMIEMMGDLIAALLSKIKKGNFDVAKEQIDQYYSDFLKNDAAFFRKLPVDNISEELLHKHNFTHNHLIILAELFYIEGELLFAQNKTDDGVTNYKKALELLTFIDKNSNTYDLERLNKIEMLRLKTK